MENLLDPYEGYQSYGFVSYSHKDSKKVFAIIQRLQSAGFKIWYDKNPEWGNTHFNYMDNRLDCVDERIINCKYFIAFHSKNSAKSERCKYETSFARNQFVNKKLYSVYLEEVELPLGVVIFPYTTLFRSIVRKANVIPNPQAIGSGGAFGAVVAGCFGGIAGVATAPIGGILGKVGSFFFKTIIDRISTEKSQSNKISLKSYEGNKPYVFISYSHEDSEKVFEILNKLQDSGLRFWYDAGTKKGSEWQDCIAEHIRDCECMLAFHSKSSNESEHCKDEISFAKWREINKKIFSVYLDKVKLFLGTQMAILRFQYLNFYEYATDKRKFFTELLESPLIQPCVSRKFL